MKIPNLRAAGAFMWLKFVNLSKLSEGGEDNDEECSSSKPILTKASSSVFISKLNFSPYKIH